MLVREHIETYVSAILKSFINNVLYVLSRFFVAIVDLSFTMFSQMIGLWLTMLLPALTLAILVKESQDFPKGLEIENLVLRPSGSVLAVTYASIPHIFEVAPTNNSLPELLYTFQNATGISSIAYSSVPDEYFLITGNFSFTTFSPTLRSYAIHHLSFDKHDKPLVKELATLEAITQPNGMVHVPGTPYVLIADCRGGIVYRFNTKTLKLSTYFDHPLLKPLESSAPVHVGVNGVKLSRGFFYFSNTNQKIIARLSASGIEASLSGDPEIVATQTSVDDFIIDDCTGDLYLAENGSNALGFVEGGDANGTVPETLLGGGNSTALLSPSAVIWAKGQEGRTLLLTNSGDSYQFVTGNFTGGGRITIVHVG